MVRALLEMGQGRGADVVAEGVENDAAAEALRDPGVRGAQGYLLARPVDPDGDIAASEDEA